MLSNRKKILYIYDNLQIILYKIYKMLHICRYKIFKNFLFVKVLLKDSLLLNFRLEFEENIFEKVLFNASKDVRFFSNFNIPRRYKILN